MNTLFMAIWRGVILMYRCFIMISTWRIFVLRGPEGMTLTIVMLGGVNPLKKSKVNLTLASQSIHHNQHRSFIERMETDAYKQMELLDLPCNRNHVSVEDSSLARRPPWKSDIVSSQFWDCVERRSMDGCHELKPRGSDTQPKPCV